MPRDHSRERKPSRVYPPEFRQQLIELVRAGQCSRAFQPSGQTIRNGRCDPSAGSVEVAPGGSLRTGEIRRQ
jgi:hypothetical protein